MTKKKRTFTRPLGERRYKKLFVIAAEGRVTERQYFDLFDRESSLIKIHYLPGHHSEPKHVLKTMRKFLKDENLQSTDEAWLVVDHDGRSEKALNTRYHWSEQADNYGFALSYPKFEYWLLLHFEDVAVTSTRRCSDKLKKYLPGFDKGIDPKMFTRKKIQDAIDRAKKRRGF